eukprot:5814705-Prymnesium_polylepis.3
MKVRTYIKRLVAGGHTREAQKGESTHVNEQGREQKAQRATNARQSGRSEVPPGANPQGRRDVALGPRGLAVWTVAVTPRDATHAACFSLASARRFWLWRAMARRRISALCLRTSKGGRRGVLRTLAAFVEDGDVHAVNGAVIHQADLVVRAVLTGAHFLARVEHLVDLVPRAEVLGVDAPEGGLHATRHLLLADVADHHILLE